MLRLGVVSFLNSRPLIEGLEQRADIQLTFAVPSALPDLLKNGQVDAALIPIVDLIRGNGRLRRVSDACIGSDGETMTVRIFSQDPPEKIQTLWVDGNSHTSVALARVLWREMYERELEIRPLDAADIHPAMRSVLLIGDKVVDPRRGSFAYEIDLGSAWRQHTGLPFVFAVWAAQTGEALIEKRILEEARDRGVALAAEIAAREGPRMGWSAEAAQRYLCRCLRFKLDANMLAGADLFARLLPDDGGALMERQEKAHV